MKLAISELKRSPDDDITYGSFRAADLLLSADLINLAPLSSVSNWDR